MGLTFKLVALFALVNAKVFPLAFHLRFYYYVFKYFYVFKNLRAKSIFEPTSITTMTPLLEMDFNLHKSNSTYFTDMDISRTCLLTKLLRKFYLEYNDPDAPQLKRHQFIYSPLGSTSMVFKKEITPYTPYKVESRIVGWTCKWLFVLSIFKASSGTIYAYGVSKYVLKQQRKTVPPEKAIEFVGLLTEEAKAQNERIQKFVQDSLDLENIIKYAA